jgi:sodium-coupled neutral amino acid transporter 10
MPNDVIDVNIASNFFVLIAFHTFGPPGKTAVELCIIGFLMGTCIAFFVVVGDLGPAIVAKTLNINNTSSLREIVLIGMLVLQYCSCFCIHGSVCLSNTLLLTVIPLIFIFILDVN